MSAMETLDHYIREELPSVIHESLPEIAPVYPYIKQTSMNVVRNQDIGRGWEVRHLYDTGIAGLMKPSNPMGMNMRDNGEYPQSHVLEDGHDVFPNAINAPHVGSIQRVLRLMKSTGNFGIPATWMQADRLNATQIEYVTRDIKGVGKMRALTEATSFFMHSGNALGQIKEVDFTLSNDKQGKFELVAGTGRTQYFRPGMCVEFFDDNSNGPDWTTKRGALQYIVSNVDYLNGVITVADVAGGDIHGQSIANDDWAVAYDHADGTATPYQMRTWGLEDWIADSGDILQEEGTSNQGLDLDAYGQFKSLIQDVGGPLTDTVLNSYVAQFMDAYPGFSLDTFISSMGVQMKYLEQPTAYNNRMFYDRQGQALDYQGGWNDVGYTFNGKKFRWLTTPMCLSGTLYAVKFGEGNVKRYVPPRIGGSNAEVGSEIEFLVPLTGATNMFKITHTSDGASTELLEAPFWQYAMVAPVDVKSVKLHGLTEADGSII